VDPNRSLKQILLVAILVLAASSSAQTADQAWLNYKMKGGARFFFPTAVRALGHDAIEQAAIAELNRNLGSLAGKDASKMSARAKEALSGQTVRNN